MCTPLLDSISPHYQVEYPTGERWVIGLSKPSRKGSGVREGRSVPLSFSMDPHDSKPAVSMESCAHARELPRLDKSPYEISIRITTPSPCPPGAIV